MEEVKKKIIQLLDQFLKEEFGNRLSQFSLLSLKSLIMDELKKLEDHEKLSN